LSSYGHSALVLARVVALPIACLYFAAANAGGSMVEDQSKQGSSPKTGAQSPSTGGGMASDPERPAPLPGTERAAPKPGLPSGDDFDKLKENASKPAPHSSASQGADEDSSNH